MPKPAFLVDGDLEQRVVQRLCPGTTVQIVHRNGKDVALSAMAGRIATLIRNMGNRVRHQSIWNRWVAKLTESLAHLGFDIRQRLCGVASAVV